MRFWKKPFSILSNVLAAIAVAGCARDANHAEMILSSARLEQRGTGSWLAAEGDWRPSAEMLEALDHGISLTLRLQLDAQQRGWFGAYAGIASIERHRELRYFPLTRRYQVRDVEQGAMQSFGVRAAAIAALGHLEIPVDAAMRCGPAAEGTVQDAQSLRYRLRIDFDRAGLPGALRLPALVLSAWHQDRAEWIWSCPASA
ncbi:MAG: DUF4390 domain-containing protein [Tahibacter sp.]